VIDKKSNGCKKYKSFSKSDATAGSQNALRCTVSALTCKYFATKTAIVAGVETNS
jgi:hypothetical protein